MPVRRPIRTAVALGSGLVTLLFAASAGGASAAPSAPAGATTARPGSPAAELPGFYDGRQAGGTAGRTAAAERSARAGASAAVRTLRAGLGDQALVDIDPLTSTPRQVARLDGLLTGPSSKAAAAVVLDYVRAQGGVFRLTAGDLAGLRLRRDYVDVAGTHHLSWVQTAGGVPLFGNGLQAAVTRSGALVNVLGSPVAGLRAPAGAGRLSRDEAVRRARADLRERSLTAGAQDRATPVLFQTAAGTRRAWQTITMSAARPALHVIDALDGRVLYRRSLTADATRAEGRAFQYFPGARRGGVQEQIDFTGRGWLPGAATTLSGNNTHTYADVNDSDAAEAREEVPPSRGRSWNYPLVPFRPFKQFCGDPYPCSWDPDVPYSWRTNRNQNATQVFAFVNNFHDHLKAEPIGFSEAAGNFQTVNHTGRGRGGDAVQAQSDDGANVDHGLPDASHVDNANMSTPPDGIAPRMQMYLQHLPGTSYPKGDPFAPTNVGDEADTVYHEYTHGLSNRLVVDAGGNSTLGNVQAGSMGEAWSDWYAMDYLVAQGLQPDRPQVQGDVVIFQYDGAGVKVDRTQPIDCPVGSTSRRCPGTETAGPGGYTYGDFGRIGAGPEVHDDGEIWTQTLWDLRRSLGSVVAESLVTRAMELSPANPSFLDERNAILQADSAIYGGGYRGRIWRVFAARGMGFFAATASGDDTHPVQSFALPPAPGTARGSLTGRVVATGSGRGIGGAVVAFGGHASGFPGDYSAVTRADGSYTIDRIFVGNYRKVSASAAGYVPRSGTVRITRGRNTKTYTLTRDWAAASGGARVTSFSGPDYTDFGCGPRAAIDLALGSGWGSTSDLGGNGKPTAKTPKSVVVRLPRPVDISRFGVDPGNTCGDSPSAATGKFRIATSTDGKTYRTAAQGEFGPADLHRVNPVPVAAGAARGVRFVRFTMVEPQVFAIGGSCPGNYSGCSYLDMSELEVFGR